MKKKVFEIIIASHPDKENLVAEVYYKSTGWAEISAETPNKFVVTLGNCNRGNKGKYWEFSYDEAMEVLQEAKRQLAEKQRTPEQQKRYDKQMKELENWKPTPEETAEYERKKKEQWEKYYGQIFSEEFEDREINDY